LPRLEARLTSGRCSGATGRAFTRRIPLKGFGSASYISSPFPKPCLSQSHRPKRARIVSSFRIRILVVSVRRSLMRTVMRCELRQ
jgi:hypothetical protein